MLCRVGPSTGEGAGLLVSGQRTGKHRESDLCPGNLQRGVRGLWSQSTRGEKAGTCYPRPHHCATRPPLLPSVLESPRDLQFSDVGETSARATWVPPSSRVDSFKISYQLADGGDDPFPPCPLQLSPLAHPTPAHCPFSSCFRASWVTPSPTHVCRRATECGSGRPDPDPDPPGAEPRHSLRGDRGLCPWL